MIIVEGPDGAGKSTLVKEILSKYDVQPGIKAARNRDELYKTTKQDTYLSLGVAVSGVDKPEVHDRLYFSELAYHKPMRRECAFSHREKQFIHKVLAALSCPIIVCLPPLRTVLENYHDGTHQLKFSEDQLVQLWNYYDVLSHNEIEGKRFIHYDYTGDSHLETIDLILAHYLERRKVREWQ